MLLHILHFRVFPHKKPVDPVMLGILVSTVVDAAPRHDDHVRVISYIKIIVHHLRQAALAEYHRDMHALTLCPCLDVNINPLLSLFLGNDLNVGGIHPSGHLPVCPDIVRSRGNLVEVRHLLQKPHLNGIHIPDLCHLISLPYKTCRRHPRRKLSPKVPAGCPPLAPGP